MMNNSLSVLSLFDQGYVQNLALKTLKIVVVQTIFGHTTERIYVKGNYNLFMVALFTCRF